MPYRITYVLDPLRRSNERALASRMLDVQLDALTQIDVLYLKAHPEVPSIYRSGVRYMAEPPGQEDWQDIPTSLKMGIVDSEDAACWRAAELRVRHNIQAKPFFGEDRCHARVMLPDGSIEDPSALLGMKKPACETSISSGRIVFALDLFNGPKDRKLSHDTLNIMLDALTANDVLYLRAYPNTVGIYDSNVVYMEEPPGQEDWQDVPTTLLMGNGDCEDFACWRAAELIVRHGEAAKAFFRESRRKDGGYLFHILVRRADGTIEDPSRVKGMR
jgi:hypothetical protein